MHTGVFLGLATTDIIYYVPRHPRNNEKLRAERQLSFAGGPATNAAVAFAAFGNAATLVTGLGSHPLAQLPKNDIADFNVHLIDCADKPKRPPILASIMVDLSTGERCVVYAHAEVRKLKSEAIRPSILEGAHILMLDGHYLPQAMHLAELARSRGIPVVLDGGSWKEGLDLLLPLIDYAICSDNFHPPGCMDKQGVISSLREAGIEHIAITRDDDPIIAHHQGKTIELPVLGVDALDTMGAGDIFHGAFCHFLLREDFLTSLREAAKIAGLSCTSLGTRAWIDLAKIG